MKSKFKNNQYQLSYITKFISYYTSLERKCQFCGKPAIIKHNEEDPYRIQLVCRECRSKYKIPRDKMYNNIPLIDCRDYINNERTLANNIKLTPELKKLLDESLEKGLSKKETLDYVNITYTQFNKLIKQYETSYDKDIAKKFQSSFYKSRADIIREAKLKSTLTNDSGNNLSKIKLEKNISNRQIVDLSNKGITAAQLSCIQRGICKPKVKTKCLLAEILKVSVSDIFPKDEEFNNIHNYSDYIKLSDRYREILSNYKEEYSTTLKYISREINLDYNRLRAFITENLYNLESEDFKLIRKGIIDKVN